MTKRAGGASRYRRIPTPAPASVPAPRPRPSSQAWLLIERMSSLMAAATGNACNMDVLAWYVDPNAGAAGFSPHRDRQPGDAAATFRADGSAMYTTAWVR
jgi:hypothetical protein